MSPEISALTLHDQQAPSRQHHTNNTTIRMTELHHRLHKGKSGFYSLLHCTDNNKLLTKLNIFMKVLKSLGVDLYTYIFLAGIFPMPHTHKNSRQALPFVIQSFSTDGWHPWQLSVRFPLVSQHRSRPCKVFEHNLPEERCGEFHRLDCIWS